MLGHLASQKLQPGNRASSWADGGYGGVNKPVPPTTEKSSVAGVNQGLQPCQQTTESPSLRMASFGKKRRREKVMSSPFAEVGEQLRLPLTISQSHGIGLGTLEAKPTPGVA